MDEYRRGFLVATTITGASVLLGACSKGDGAKPESSAKLRAPTLPDASAMTSGQPKESDDNEVTATEDLMREHGVIRRVLVVYRESALRLTAKGNVPPEALQKAAKLMRTFGEDYHEKQLEEAYIFPAVKKAGGVAASEIDALLAQHQRGREITDYVMAVTQKTIATATAEPLAHALEGFSRMYEEHTAREDTIVFPAWKKSLSKKALDEMGDKFEDIEHQTFGKDGFDDAVDQIAAIEKLFGLDPTSLMPPPPPKP